MLCQLIESHRIVSNPGEATLQLGSEDDKANLYDTDKQPQEEEPEEQVEMKEALNFPLPFWILVVSCVVSQGDME